MTQGTEQYDISPTDDLLDKHLTTKEFVPFTVKKNYTRPNPNRSEYIEKGQIDLNSRNYQTVSGENNSQENELLMSSEQKLIQVQQTLNR